MATDSEKRIMRDIQLAATKVGARLWRNNVGLFLTQYFSPIRCGLCTGSSDLIGIMPDGRFLAVEVKTMKGDASKKQLAFIRSIRDLRGVAFIARSVEDFNVRFELERLGKKCR